jgi:hypothetical protein
MNFISLLCRGGPKYQILAVNQILNYKYEFNPILPSFSLVVVMTIRIHTWFHNPSSFHGHSHVPVLYRSSSSGLEDRLFNSLDLEHHSPITVWPWLVFNRLQNYYFTCASLRSGSTCNMAFFQSFPHSRYFRRISKTWLQVNTLVENNCKC